MYTLPNFLSLTRILLILPLLIYLINGSFFWALAIFVICALTDAADGMLARLMQQRTIIGSYLDPIADKLLTASSYLSLAILGLVPAWLTILIISRDVIIVGGLLILFWKAHFPKVQPTLVSKITTVLQLSTIMVVLLAQIKPIGPFLLFILIWATGGFTLISGFQYIKKGIDLISPGAKRGALK